MKGKGETRTMTGISDDNMILKSLAGTKDHDLQQKIDHEIKMRDGTAKLLAASKHPAQMLEAAKNLLTSNTRIISYMTELQRRKTAEVMGKNSTSSVAGNQVPCKAKVCVSDIRIPLMWKDTDHFKNKGDHRRYVVFCLLKIGTEIYDTSMVNNVDRSMTDITFDDVIAFNNISHDFECKLEIYCHKLHEDLTIASTSKKLRKKMNDLSGSVGRSVGKRLSGLKDDADIIGNMVLGPRFELMATGSLTLADVDNCIRTYDLQLEPVSEAGSELPLFGHYCCKFSAHPECLREPAGTGFLNLQANSQASLQEDDDLSKWKKYWCVLKNLEMACWSSPTDVDVTQPLFTIPVTKNTQISDADPRTCKRSHTFHLKTVQGEFVSEHTLAAENKEELNKWWEAFQQHLLDQVFWKHACEQPVDMRSASPRKLPLFLRKSSLYEDTPINDRSSYNEEVIDNLQMDEKQLSQMLNTLMGEAKEIRGDTSSTASSSSTGT
ncbi:rhotekin-2-like isoform X2 [Liolophura sinensis]|uniref:rhotekin-2-like isoform X2 n=1 Tax=Liolophura sinensis TaxID=3198878 RepID=UPI003158A469